MYKRQVVLEAMKMQSNYKVTSDCTVRDILVNEGDSVKANQVLIAVSYTHLEVYKRQAQHQAGFGEQCFYSGRDMHQLLMVEKPRCVSETALYVLYLLFFSSCNQNYSTG